VENALQEFANVLMDFVGSTVATQYVQKTVAIVESVSWPIWNCMEKFQHLAVLKHPVSAVKDLKEMLAILDDAPTIAIIQTVRIAENVIWGFANVIRIMRVMIAPCLLESVTHLEVPYLLKVLLQRSTITGTSKIKWLNSPEVFCCVMILTFWCV